MGLLLPCKESAWSCLEAGRVKHFKCMSQTRLRKRARKVNAAIIILVTVSAVEADTDVESAIMAAAVVITKAVQQQAPTCLFPSFKLRHQKKEMAIFLR